MRKVCLLLVRSSGLAPPPALFSAKPLIRHSRSTWAERFIFEGHHYLHAQCVRSSIFFAVHVFGHEHPVDTGCIKIWPLPARFSTAERQ
jgi:hypothetical protein